MADRAYGIVGATARTYGKLYEHWRIIKNQARIGKAFRLQRGYWRDGRVIGAGWGRDEFKFDYEEYHDTREQAQAARIEWQHRKKASNG